MNKLALSAVAAAAVVGAVWALPGALGAGSRADLPGPAAMVTGAVFTSTSPSQPGSRQTPVPAVVTVPALTGPTVAAAGSSRAAAPGVANTQTHVAATAATSNPAHLTPVVATATARPPTSDRPSATPAATSAPVRVTPVTSAQRVAPKPTVPQPVTPKPAAPKPAAPKPTVPQSVTSKPAAPPATVPRPVAPKPAPRKPIAPTPAPGPAPHFAIPVNVGNARQIITVTAASGSSTVGTLVAWQKQPNGSWTTVFGPLTAHLGSDGVGAASEYSARTPQGTWTMTQAFGRSSNPGTALPYSRVNTRDWWVSDVNSSDYNTHQVCSPGNCTFDTGASENLYNAGQVYDYAVVMDVNRWPATPGGGSAYFLHVTDGGPTAGCISVGAGSLVAIMRWLSPAAHPRIAVGIG